MRLSVTFCYKNHDRPSSKHIIEGITLVKRRNEYDCITQCRAS